MVIKNEFMSPEQILTSYIHDGVKGMKAPLKL